MAVSATISTARPISAYAKTYLEGEKGHVTEGTKGQKEATLKLLVGILGDIQADSIKREDAMKLHRSLQRVPRHFTKSSKADLAAVNRALLPEPGPETMGTSTLERHWRTVLAFYRYVNVQDDVRPIDLDRTFGQMRWDPKVREEEDRDPWTDSAIEKLFVSPIWTGFEPHPKKRYWRHEPGHVIVKDEHWWLPLLGLFQGARLEELCQLRGSDVKSDAETEILYLDFHEGMNLKSKASVRKVPVHSTILRLGLHDLAAGAGSDLLFPRLVPGGRDQKLSFDYTDDFGKYRKRVGVYVPLMDFHAFRHNFTTQIVEDKTLRSMLIADELTGHDSKERKEIKERGGSITLGYFGGHLMTSLKEAIERVAYPQINLERILESAKAAEPKARALEDRHPAVWGERAVMKERKVRPSSSRVSAAE